MAIWSHWEGGIINICCHKADFYITKNFAGVLPTFDLPLLQCDQIWRNFATLAKNYKYLAYFLSVG